MNRDAATERLDEPNKPETYRLSGRDRGLVSAAMQLLEKIIVAPFTRPAEMVSVAKALHVLKLLPRVMQAEVALQITLNGPLRWFGEHEIWHWWTVQINGPLVHVYSGGHFYRKSTGGDSFTSLQWSAEPGLATEYRDYLEHLQIVDDAQPFRQEVKVLSSLRCKEISNSLH